MGNALANCFTPVISVHHSDGTVRRYMPPVCVMDLLREYPNYCVVVMKDGTTTILSSDLHLQPGSKYYLLSPNRLFYTIDDSDTCDDRCQQAAKFLRKVMTIDCLSVSALFQVCGNPVRSPSKKRLLQAPSRTYDNSQTTGIHVTCRQTPLYTDESVEIHSAGESVITDIMTPSRDSISREMMTSPGVDSPAWEANRRGNNLRSRYYLGWNSPIAMGQEKWHSPKIDEKWDSPKVDERRASAGSRPTSRPNTRPSSTRKPNKTSESTTQLEKDSGCFWSVGLKRVKREGTTIISQASSKEKWLEDMIRGAENQWKRVQPEPDIANIGDKAGNAENEVQQGSGSGPARLGRMYLPHVQVDDSQEISFDSSQCFSIDDSQSFSTTPRNMTATPSVDWGQKSHPSFPQSFQLADRQPSVRQQEEDHDRATKLQQEEEHRLSVKLEEVRRLIAQQEELRRVNSQQEDERQLCLEQEQLCRQSSQHEFRGKSLRDYLDESMRRTSSKAMRLENEQTNHQISVETSAERDDRSKLMIDEMERQFLLRSTPSAGSSMIRNLVQKITGRASTDSRTRSPDGR